MKCNAGLSAGEEFEERRYVITLEFFTNAHSGAPPKDPDPAVGGGPRESEVFTRSWVRPVGESSSAPQQEGFIICFVLH